MTDMWVERHRPNAIEEYVFKDADQRKEVEHWINEGKLPNHVMFAGIQGTGKTSLALMLFKEFGIPKGDICEINASHENGIGVIREKITKFCSTWSLSGGLKYVLLDEVDRMTPEAQDSLKGVMEKYSSSIRFVLTCNNPNRVTPPIHSRIQLYTFTSLNKEEFLIRIGEILTSEDIEVESLDVLQEYIDCAYPDMRKCVNLLQPRCLTGTLLPMKDDTEAVADYLIEMVNLIQSGRINNARLLVTANARQEEYIDIYRFMYRNLELWGESKDLQGAAILTIAEYLKNDTLVADREINLAACFVSLEQIINA